MKKTISKTRLMVTCALGAYVGPRLAKDKKFDVVPYFKSLTAKNYATTIKPAITKLCQDAEPMLAPEAGGAAAKMGPDDVIHMLASHIIGGEAPSPEAIETDEVPMEAPAPAEAGGNEALMAFLAECGLDETAMAKVKSLLGGGAAPPKPGADEDDDDAPPVTQEAMDKAIKKAAADSAASVKKEMQETAEAREFVRPWVGIVPMALDSATKVLQAACGTLKIEGADKVTDDHALRLLIGGKPKPGARVEVQNANDGVPADVAADFAKRYPHASNINVR